MERREGRKEEIGGEREGCYKANFNVIKIILKKIKFKKCPKVLNKYLQKCRAALQFFKLLPYFITGFSTKKVNPPPLM